MNIIFKLFRIFIVIIIFILSGCVNTDIKSIDENQISSHKIEAYKLKPLDPLAIRFNGILEQQGLEVIIDEGGFISLLHLEPIQAAGLTTSELEEKIERNYIDGEIYRNVSVNVIMTSKKYTMSKGKWMQPGQFQLASGTTLLQAIATARGYSPYANEKKVTITRQEKISQYNMKEIEKDPSLDIKIEAGDVIKVWTRWY